MIAAKPLKRGTRPRNNLQKTERDALVLSVYSLVWWLARRHKRLAGNLIQVDDLASEGLYAVCRAAREYDPGRGPFPAYARHVAIRQMYSAARVAMGRGIKRRVQKGEEAPRLRGGLDRDYPLHDRRCRPILTQLAIEEEARHCRQAIEVLPDRYRVPASLVWLDGMQQSEAAEQLGLSRQVMSLRLERVRDKLSMREAAKLAMRNAAAREYRRGRRKPPVERSGAARAAVLAALESAGRPITSNEVVASIQRTGERSWTYRTILRVLYALEAAGRVVSGERGRRDQLFALAE